MAITLVFSAESPPLSVIAAAGIAGVALSTDSSAPPSSPPLFRLSTGSTLQGTNALLQHLGQIAPLPNFYGRDHLESGQIDKLLEYASIFLSGGEFEAACRHVDSYLTLRTFLVGFGISVADIAIWAGLAGTGQRWESLRKSKKYPNLSRWFNSILTEYSDVLNEIMATYVGKRGLGKPLTRNPQRPEGNGEVAPKDRAAEYEVDLPGASRYEVEVTIQSARDLKNVNWRNGPVKAYAVVWIDPAAKCTTKADVDGDTNPNWDEKLIVPLGDRPLDDAVLHIDVVHAGSSDGVKPLIGSARLPLREVLDEAGMGGKFIRSMNLKRPSGRPHGMIDVKVKVAPRSDPRYSDPYAQPYGAGTRDPYGGGYGQPYAAPPPSGYPYSAPPYGAAPPQPAYGYGAAPPVYGQAGYGAPPSAYGQPGYAAAQPAYGQSSYEKDSFGAAPSSGYGQTAPVAEKKSKFGMGTGLAVGAAAGLLGGLALYEGAEFVEDKIADKAEEKVEEDEYGEYYDNDY